MEFSISYNLFKMHNAAAHIIMNILACSTLSSLCFTGIQRRHTHVMFNVYLFFYKFSFCYFFFFKNTEKFNVAIWFLLD